MRTLMKTFMATLILATLTFAGPKALDTERVNKNIIEGLINDNPGVTESTIGVIMLMKAAYPEADYDDIIDELEDLVMDGANKNIRLKAFIASDYLRNFEQYKWLKEKNYSEGDQIFDAYLDSMSSKRIAISE